MKKFIVVVDTQYDFMMADGKLPVPGAEDIVVPGIRFLAGLKPEATAGVLFTFDTHTKAAFLGSPENLGDPARGVPGFPLHSERGTPGWENVFNPRLIPAGIPVYQLEKGVFDPWQEEGLALVAMSGLSPGAPRICPRDDFFSRELAGFHTLVVFGVAGDYCVKWAVEGFLARGFQVEVPTRLTRGIERRFDEIEWNEDSGTLRLI